MEEKKPNDQLDHHERIKAMIISFVGTAVIAIATKLITILLARPEIDNVIIYLSEQYSFWFQLIAGSGGAAFITNHFLKRSKH